MGRDLLLIQNRLVQMLVRDEAPEELEHIQDNPPDEDDVIVEVD